MKLVLQNGYTKKRKEKEKLGAMLIYVTDILYSYFVHMPFLNL